MNARPMRARTIAIAVACAGAALLALANAHFVYVAVVSQPDCVAHLKAGSQKPGSYRAARPAC
jgi:hypothetical protein